MAAFDSASQGKFRPQVAPPGAALDPSEIASHAATTTSTTVVSTDNTSGDISTAVWCTCARAGRGVVSRCVGVATGWQCAANTSPGVYSSLRCGAWRKGHGNVC